MAGMKLRLLLIEDNESDALLIARELRRGGYDVVWQRVDTAGALLAALAHQQWDVVTCDWVMPHLSASAALGLLREHGIGAPIIIVSGEVGEEVAVSAMQAGAHDFVSKDRLTRLVPAIERELRETEGRRARKRAEDALKESEQHFRSLIEKALGLVSIVDVDGTIRYASPSHEQVTGYTPEELIGRNAFELVHPDDVQRVTRRFAAGLARQEQSGSTEYRFRRKDGSWCLVEGVARNLTTDPVVRGVLVNSRDITERHRTEQAARERTRMLDAVFDHSLSCLVLLDRHFNFIRVNPAYARACRREVHEFAGCNHFDLYPSDAQTIFEQVVESRQPFAVLARPFSFPDQPDRGVTYWDWTLVPLLDDRGEVELLLFSLHDVTEHVRMAEALRKGEERFRSLIERSLDLIAVVDSDGTYRYVNLAHEATSGFRPDELVGTNAFDLLHPDDARHLAPRLAAAIRTGEKGATVEYRLRHKDGSWRFVEGVALNLFDDPEVRGLLVTGRDVTARRWAEQALRANEERLQVSLRVADIAAFNQDRELRYTWMARPQLGYTVDQVVGRTDAELLPPDGAACIMALKRRVMDTNVGAREEVRVTADGQTRYYDLALEPLRDAAGAAIGLTGASFDITERKRAEERMRAHALRLDVLREIYRAILEARSVSEVVGATMHRMRDLVPCALAVVLLFDVDAGVARVVASEPREGLGGDITTLPLADFSTLATFVEQSVICIEDIATLERPSPIVQRLCAAGMRSLLTQALISEGELLGVLHLSAPQPAAFDAEHRDIAREVADQVAIAIHQAHLREQLQRHAAELERRVQARTEQYEAANKELATFSYSVSHDLRAPLRAISGFSKVLLEEYGAALGTDGRYYADRIAAGTQRMGQLIEDLLRLARVAQQEMAVQSVNLSDLARGIADDLRKSAPHRRVEFVIAPGVVATGDGRLLRIVLDNLLSNAWKYTGKHPTARIDFGRTERDGRPVYFVRDDGAGFDMAYAGKLFGAFQRLHSESEFEGSGIGLATVQRIIHRHGGRIWAEGAVEKGATFSFTLGS